MCKRYFRPLVLAAAVVSVFSLACEPDESITAPGERQPPIGLSGSFRGTYVELTWKPTLPGKETTYEIFRSVNEPWYYEKIGEVEYADGEDTYKYIDVKFERDNNNFYKVRTAYGGNTGEFSNQVVVTTNTFWLWNAARFDQMVFKINPLSGSIMASFPTPFRGSGTDREPSGLTWDDTGKYLWHAEMISDRIYRTRDTGKNGFFLDAPNGRPSGLAWDGTYLWNADFEKDEIYRIDVGAEKVLGSFPSPGPHPFGLTWDGAYLWNADTTNGLIYKIDSANGSVLASFRSPDVAPTGLAWDGTYLWNADKRKDEIYKINPVDGSVLASFSFRDRGPQGLAVQERF
jgi:hypothetical protein